MISCIWHFSKSNDSFLSWIGLLAALLFGCQWALGFAAFLFPKFSPEIRALILPFHQVHVQRCSFMQSSILTWPIAYLDQYFGSAILALAVAAACMGHLEKMIWSNMAGVREIFCSFTLGERYNYIFSQLNMSTPLFFWSCVICWRHSIFENANCKPLTYWTSCSTRQRTRRPRSWTQPASSSSSSPWESPSSWASSPPTTSLELPRNNLDCS